MSSIEDRPAVETTLLAQLTGERAAFRAEGEVTVETRRDRLDRLARLVAANRRPIAEAVVSDSGHRSRDLT
jgi:coniferyl-aldehyde dehydrogenase